MPDTTQTNSNSQDTQSESVANNLKSEENENSPTGLTITVCGTNISVPEDGGETTITITPFAGATLTGPIILEKDKENDLVTAKYEEVTLTLTAAIPSLDADVTVKVENFYADSDGKITGTFTEDVDLTVMNGLTLSLTQPTISKDDASSDFEISSTGSVKGENDPTATSVLEATIGGGGVNWAAEADKPTLSFEFGDYFSITEAKMADYKGSGSDFTNFVTGGLSINAGDVVTSSEDASVTAKYNNRIDDGEISIDGDLVLSVMGQEFTLSALTYTAAEKKLSGDSAELAIDVNGFEEKITITNPSLTKGADGMTFDFESAEGSSETEVPMFNDIVVVGPHTIKLDKKDTGNELEATGTLKIQPIKELEGEIEGGFTYSKADGLKPKFSSGTIKLNKDFEPVKGVTVGDLFLGVEKDEDENTNFIGGGTLKLSIPKPKIEGEGTDMKLSINPKTKDVSFEVASITVSSGLGDIGITNFEYADGEIAAEEGKFEFDSAKITDGDYFGGAAASMMGGLKGLGVKFDITASDITINKTDGFKIGRTEKKVNEVKISILGAEALYNFKEKKANIAAKLNILEMLTGSDAIGVTMLFPLFPGVFATFGAGIRNGGEIELKIELAKAEENFWDLMLLADFNGSSIMAYIEGGVQVGSGWLASVYAKLGAEGGVNFEDPSKLEAKSKIQTSSPDGKSMIPKPKTLDINMELTLPVILQLYLTLGFQALKFFKFEYKKVLAKKELTKFNPKKTFSWQAAGFAQGSLGAKDILNKEQSDTPIQEYKPNEKHLQEIERMQNLSNSIISKCRFDKIGEILNVVNENKNYVKLSAEEEDTAVVKGLGLTIGKSNSAILNYFDIKDDERKEFNKLDKNIPQYRELEEIAGKENLNEFVDKMDGRREIFAATARMIPTFTNHYWFDSNKVEEQKATVERFVTAYLNHKGTLVD